MLEARLMLNTRVGAARKTLLDVSNSNTCKTQSSLRYVGAPKKTRRERLSPRIMMQERDENYRFK